MALLLFLFSFFHQDVDSTLLKSQSKIVSLPSSTVKQHELRFVAEDSTFVLSQGVGPYSLAERVENLTKNIDLLKEQGFSPDDLTINADEEVFEILAKEMLLMTVTSADAKALGLTKRGAADFYKEKLTQALDKKKVSIERLLLNIGIALVIVILFGFGLKFYNRIFRWVYIKIHGKKGDWFKGLNFKNYEFLSPEKEVVLLVYTAKVFRIALLVFIIYLLLPVLFSLFPWTQDIAVTLIGYVLSPIQSLAKQFVGFIPNLLAIVVIVVIVRYLVKALTFFRVEVEKNRLEIPGFYPEWARPTFNLVKIMVFALAFVGIWPLLPMSDSDVFKGVSTFFGVLLALGGAGAFSNVIAGLVITYMRSFKIGDRVKIAEVVGDVTEKTLLNTKIKTIKNEIITIPNSQLLSSHTINYTSANEEDGLFLFTTVTLGYDVPWRKVHKVLVEAALATEFVKKLPKPFVLQTSLDDFYVSYQLNVRTREVHKMANIYSELHQNIQDKCNEAGIEIMSPHYGAVRDGNQSTIPQENLPEDYQARWFRIKKEDK